MVRLLLAEDHPVVREGLRALLEEEAGLEVVGQTGDGAEVGPLVEDLRPDVVVLDLMMPGVGGLEVTRDVARRFPGTSVLILSMHANEAYVLEALRSGAAGYALKQADGGELVRAIQEVAAGRRYLSPPLSERAVEAYARRAQGAPPDLYTTLTAREREVLQLVAEGQTSPAIARRLYISPRTVESHRARLMRKLGLRSQAEVIRYAVGRGIVPADLVSKTPDGPLEPIEADPQSGGTP
jgi:DNA-binding NarL/FixJ family response regulator